MNFYPSAYRLLQQWYQMACLLRGDPRVIFSKQESNRSSNKACPFLFSWFMLLSSLWDGIINFVPFFKGENCFDFPIGNDDLHECPSLYGAVNLVLRNLFPCFDLTSGKGIKFPKSYFSALEIRIWIMLFFRTGRLRLIESQYLRKGEVGRELWKSSNPHISNTTLTLPIQAGSAVVGCPGWCCSWCTPGHRWLPWLPGPCWHISNSASTRTPKSLSVALLPSISLLRLCTSRGRPSQVRNLALSIAEICHSGWLPLGVSLGPTEDSSSLIFIPFHQVISFPCFVDEESFPPLSFLWTAVERIGLHKCLSSSGPRNQILGNG